MKNSKKEPTLEQTTIKSLMVLDQEGFEAYKDMILEAYATSDQLTELFYKDQKEEFDADKLSGVMAVISMVANAKFNRLVKKEDKEKYNALVQLLMDRATDLIKIKNKEDVETYCKE